MKDLITYFSQFLPENKINIIEEKLKLRTEYMTLVLEDIYQSHNASAVLRTSECFGINTVHVIENMNKYSLQTQVAMGAGQWMNVKQYNQSQENNSMACLTSLKEQGYRIVATSPHSQGVNLEDFEFNGKFALVFGNEKLGISGDVAEMADDFLNIPMFGFTESLNISVSAGICIHHLIHKLHKSDVNFQLTEEEQEELKLKWYRRIIRNAEQLEKHFLEKNI